MISSNPNYIRNVEETQGIKRNGFPKRKRGEKGKSGSKSGIFA